MKNDFFYIKFINFELMKLRGRLCSLECIFSVRHFHFNLILILSKIKEMSSSMLLMIEIFWIIQDYVILHILVKVDTIEVEIPYASFRNHEEAKEFV